MPRAKTRLPRAPQAATAAKVAAKVKPTSCTPMPFGQPRAVVEVRRRPTEPSSAKADPVQWQQGMGRRRVARPGKTKPCHAMWMGVPSSLEIGFRPQD